MTQGISRRNLLSVFGLAALSLAVPTVLTVSPSEAQTAPAPTAATPADVPMTGTERRQERRMRRTARRQGRRIRRLERRQTRREGRRARRMIRREGREIRRDMRGM
jgi:hypothetical protein